MLYENVHRDYTAIQLQFYRLTVCTVRWHLGEVVVGYISQHGSSLSVVRYEDEEDVVQRMKGFLVPFCLLYNEHSKKAIRCFKALTRYYFLSKGSSWAIEDDMEEFEAHFPGACRDVAVAHDAEKNEAEPEIHREQQLITKSMSLYKFECTYWNCGD